MSSERGSLEGGLVVSKMSGCCELVGSSTAGDGALSPAAFKKPDCCLGAFIASSNKEMLFSGMVC